MAIMRSTYSVYLGSVQRLLTLLGVYLRRSAILSYMDSPSSPSSAPVHESDGSLGYELIGKANKIGANYCL